MTATTATRCSLVTMSLTRLQCKCNDKLAVVQVRNGTLQPVLQRLPDPVRAIVAPLAGAAAISQLHSALQSHIVPLFKPQGIWLQDSQLLHTTVWHASPHQVQLLCVTLYTAEICIQLLMDLWS